MSPRANVRSLEAIRRVKPALIQFEGDVTLALGALRQELHRTLDWLDHECPAYWQQQVRLSFDRLAKARTELSRKQMMTVGGRHPDCIEEKKLLQKAKRQLEFAEGKLKTCREWSIKAHRASDEFNSRIGRMEQTLLQSLPQARAVIERIVTALGAYVTVEGSSETAYGSVAHSSDATDSTGADAAGTEVSTGTESVTAEAVASALPAEPRSDELADGDSGHTTTSRSAP